MRNNEGQTSKKTDCPHFAMCSAFGLLHSSGFTTHSVVLFQTALLVWLHIVPPTLDHSTQLHWTMLGLGLGSAPLDLVCCCFVPPPASSRGAIALAFCWAQLCSLLGAVFFLRDGKAQVVAGEGQSPQHWSQEEMRKKQYKIVHFCCTLLLLKPGPQRLCA